MDSRLRGNDVDVGGNDVDGCGHVEGQRGRWLGLGVFRAWGFLLGLWFRRVGLRFRVVCEFCFVKCEAGDGFPPTETFE